VTKTSLSPRAQRAPTQGPTGVINAGRDVIQAGRDIITGDVFVGPFARLRDRWIDPAPIFRDVQVERFEGREWLVAQLDKFIEDNDHGHFIVQADAGLGKTALAAWLAWRRNWPCHFTRLSNGQVSLIALSNLGAQLIARYGLGDEYAPQGMLSDAAGEAGWFQNVLQAAADAARAGGEPLVIVADGLDEAEPVRGALPLGLPVLLPRGAYIVATCRTGTNLLALRQPKKEIEIKPGSRRNSDDLSKYLATALTTDDRLVRVLDAAGLGPREVAERLQARCGGVWIYLRYVLNELRSGERSVDDIDSLPGDLFAYYSETLLLDHRDPNWGRTVLPLLATLAVAAEPLPISVLTRLAGLPEEHPVQLLCGGRLLPFLTATPSPDDGLLHYSVYHASLREFLMGTAPLPATGSARAQAEQFARAAAAAHSRIADTYLEAFGGLGQGLPVLAADPQGSQRDGGYALRHLTEHLELAHREEDLTVLLAQELPSPEFGSVWYTAHEQSGTLAEYRADLNRARRLAADRTDRDVRRGRAAASIALEIRYLMIDAAIRASVPVNLIGSLVENGLWTPARALFYARQPVDPDDRATRLAWLLDVLPEKDQSAIAQEALALARQVRSTYWRAWAYSVLAAYLPGAHAREAAQEGLTATATVEYDDAKSDLLARFAGQLPTDLVPQAAGIAQAISGETERVQALLALVPVVPESVLPDMVAALTGVAEGSLRLRLLVGIAARGSETVVDALTAAARTLTGGNRAWALGAIAEIGSATGLALVAEAVDAARQATDPAERAELLRRLSRNTEPSQREQLLAEALSDARSAPEDVRVRAVLSVAEALPAPHRRSVIVGLVGEALDQPPGPDRTRYLAGLAGYLTERQLEKVIPAVLATESEEDKAELLIAYASTLPEQFVRRALQAAATVRDEARRGAVIEGLAPALPESLLGEALSLVSGITNPDIRWSTVAVLAERLPERHLGQALSMVQSSARESGAARFLLAVAQRGGEPRRPELVREALASARAATDGFSRAQALGDIAASLDTVERDRVLAEAGEAAEASVNDYTAVYALDYLIRRSSGRLRRKLTDAAFARTRSMSDTWWRSAWLARLARHVPKAEHSVLLAEALADARSLSSKQERASALLNMATDFPGDERIGICHELLALAGDGEGLERGLALALPIARSLPDRLLLRCLELLRKVSFEDTRPPSFGWLLRLIPDRKMDEVLTALRNYPFGLSHAHGLGTAALYVPERIRPQVLTLALDAYERVIARRAILTQAQWRWPDRLTQVELDIFRRVLADNELDDFLNILAAALDVIVKVGGTPCVDECLDAFRTIQRWWPPFEIAETSSSDGLPAAHRASRTTEDGCGHAGSRSPASRGSSHDKNLEGTQDHDSERWPVVQLQRQRPDRACPHPARRRRRRRRGRHSAQPSHPAPAAGPGADGRPAHRLGARDRGISQRHRGAHRTRAARSHRPGAARQPGHAGDPDGGVHPLPDRLRCHPGRAVGEGEQRRHRRDGGADDLRAAVRPDHHRPGASAVARPGGVPGAVLRVPVPDRADHAVPAQHDPDGAGGPARLLLLRGHAAGLRGLGAGRVRLPEHRVRHRDERRVQDPGVRHRAQPLLPAVVHPVAGTSAAGGPIR
jgi:hypothetical protein